VCFQDRAILHKLGKIYAFEQLFIEDFDPFECNKRRAQEAKSLR
jgi:hypothetical protein